MAQLTTQVGVDPRQQAGDLHLGDPDVLGDLLLREALDETEPEDPPVTRDQLPYGGREHHACLGSGGATLLVGEQVAQAGGAVVTDWMVQGRRREATLASQRLTDIALCLSEMRCDLGRCRHAARVPCQLRTRGR